MQARATGRISEEQFRAAEDFALRETIQRMEETGSPVITDGEQTKPSFATVISASALSFCYPQNGLNGYGREAFLEDLVPEAERDVRECLRAGAFCVQIDFTEGRRALKLDPSGELLNSLVDLNNRVLDRFSAADQQKVGVHTCPGGDQDSTHSADVDYAALLPGLFSLNAGAFYIQLASEPDRPRVLRAIAEHAKPGQRIFAGVIDPIDPRIETPEEVRDRVLEAAAYIGPDRLGTCDDCGFAPFGDDTSTSRQTAFAKIRARVEGTQLAASKLGL